MHLRAAQQPSAASHFSFLNDFHPQPGQLGANSCPRIRIVAQLDNSRHGNSYRRVSSGLLRMKASSSLSALACGNDRDIAKIESYGGVSGRIARLPARGSGVWEVVAQYKSANRGQKLLRQPFRWLTPRRQSRPLATGRTGAKQIAHLAR
jgi:hypothetical protein